MEDTWLGLIMGFLGLLLGELRRRAAFKTPISVNPPPPDSEVCKRCFFFRKFADSTSRGGIGLGDTQLIHRFRFEKSEKDRA